MRGHGLTLAIQLARYGVPCRIIDTPTVRPVIKTLAVQASILQLFAARGLADEAICCGIAANGFNFYADREPLVTTLYGRR